MTLDAQPLRPMCANCGVLPARKNGISAGGYQRWQKFCSTCSKKVYAKDLKDTQCDLCGFTAVDRCQLCWVNGETLCQNCNALRLKNSRSKKEITIDATVNIWDIRL